MKGRILAFRPVWLLPVVALALSSLSPQDSLAQSPDPFTDVDDPTAVRYLGGDELLVDELSSSFSISLPTGELLEFDAVEIAVNAGVKTIKGKRKGNTILLTTDGNLAFGYVKSGHKYYVIDSVDGVPLMVGAERLPDPRLVTKGWGDDFVVDYERVLEQVSSFNESGNAAEFALSVVKVAFFYDQALADSEGLQSPRTRAQAAIDYTNAAIATHGVELELQLVYVGPLSSALAGGDPWSVFIGNTDKFTTATEYGADLLHYIYNFGSESYCGKGWLPGREAVSAAECGNTTIAHELGHNFGLHHDRANAADYGLPYSGFNYGYICGGAGTLMAYYGPTLPHFSSPSLSNNGEPCGIDIGQPNAAFNGAVFDYTRDSTAAYEQDPATIGNVSITTAGPINVDENAGVPVVVELTRDGDLSQDASVEIGTMSVDAVPGVDFEEIVQRVVFGVGEATKAVQFNAIDDETYEAAPETVDIVLRYPRKLDVVGDPLSISIISDDPDRGLAKFTDSYAAIWESHGTLLINVDRVGPTDYPLTVDFFIDPATAQPGVDYVDTSGQVAFAIGESATTISVDIIDDDAFEGYTANTFYVRLTGSNVDGSANSFPVYTWNDDLYLGQARLDASAYYVRESDGAVTFNIERINGSEGTHSVCVMFPNTGTAAGGTDYDNTQQCPAMFNGEDTTSVTATVFDNGSPDGERYFDIDLWSSVATTPPASASVFILDDDSATTGSGTVETGGANVEIPETASVFLDVRRVGGSTGAAMVDWTTVDGTATAGQDYIAAGGTLVWADGDTAPKYVGVTFTDDLVVEADETMGVQLSNVAGAVLGNSYAEIVITSDDSNGTLALSPVVQVLDESGYVDFTVQRLDGSIGSIGVSFATQSGTAIADVDFVANSGVLTWGDGDNSSRVVRIHAIDDDDYESVEEFTLELASPTGGAVIGDAVATISLQSDDAASIRSAIQGFPDINGNSAPEIAVAQVITGNTRVYVRDGSSGDVLSDVDFGSDPAYAMAVIDDISGNGAPEIAVLGTRPSGEVRVQVKDSLTGLGVNNIFYGAAYAGLDLAVIADSNANGADELAVLGRSAAGGVRVQVRDALDDAETSTTFYGSNADPIDLQVLPDINGNGAAEVVVHARVTASGQSRAQIKDTASGALIRQVFFGAAYTPLQLAVVNDVSGDGLPDLAHLGRNAGTGAVRVQVKASSGGPVISNAFIGSADLPVQVVGIGDANSSGSQDTAILVERPDGSGKVIIRDGLTGAQIRNTFMGAINSPAGLALVDDLDASGAPELAGLGESAGVQRVQVRDSISGAQINNIDYP